MWLDKLNIDTHTRREPYAVNHTGGMSKKAKHMAREIELTQSKFGI